MNKTSSARGPQHRSITRSGVLPFGAVSAIDDLLTQVKGYEPSKDGEGRRRLGDMRFLPARHRVRRHRGGWQPNYTYFSVFLEADPGTGRGAVRSRFAHAEARLPDFSRAWSTSRISRLTSPAWRRAGRICPPFIRHPKYIRLHRGSLAIAASGTQLVR